MEIGGMGSGPPGMGSELTPAPKAPVERVSGRSGQ